MAVSAAGTEYLRRGRMASLEGREGARAPDLGGGGWHRQSGSGKGIERPSNVAAVDEPFRKAPNAKAKGHEKMAMELWSFGV
jgi:hypothetical protein